MRILFLIILLVNVHQVTLAQAHSEDNSNDDLLQDLLLMTQLITDSIGSESSQLQVNNLIQQINTTEFDRLKFNKEPNLYADFKTKINGVIDQLNTNRVNSKLIEFPAAVPLPECAHVDTRDVEVSLAGKLIAEEILAYAKWECEETVLGENSALACLAPEVAAQLVKSAYEYGEFCLGNRAEANVDVILETTRSIGEHLNENIDETITSRSTQESVDEVQNSVDETNDSLDEYLPTLDTNLDTALEDLNEANETLANIHSQAESLLFRTQVNQIEIENIEIITSDIQQRAEEIRDDTQTLISNLNNIQTALVSLQQSTAAQLNLVQSVEIETTLGKSATKAPLSYQLPSNKGGMLERVREVLTGQIMTLESLGVDVSSAKKYLVYGDNDYNSGNYQSAYQNYSTAYKQLLGAGF